MRKYKILTLIATFLLAGFVGINSASAWGPERPTFTMESPASYPTFNSITDNPTIGDERDFVRIGEINADVTDLAQEVEIIPGKQYLVYVYFHNNASTVYNGVDYNRVGIAYKTRMSSWFSTVITPENKGTVKATITADNSNPLSVWDEAYMTTSTDKVLLRYVSGSAKIYNDWGTNGSVLSTNLFTEEGTLLGLNELNGVIPGCEEYHGVVTYVLQAEELGGSVSKTVSKDGENYGESVAIAPGEEAFFKVTIANTGDVALTNVTIKDSLPEGLSLVSGSVEVYADNDVTNKDQLSDNIVLDGYNLGTLGTGRSVNIVYRVKADGEFDCNGIELTNTVTLVYDSETSSGDTKKDSASVNVKKEDCPEPVVPEDPVPTPTPTPDEPIPDRIVNTGPVEITMAIVVVLGIIGGGFYLYRTRKTLKTVEKTVSGKAPEAQEAQKTSATTAQKAPEAPKDEESKK